MNWWELTWPEFERVDKTVALLPTGIVEAHGPHLPLGTDALMATYIAEETARRTNVLLLPTVWYGNTYVLDKFPGTISISNETLYRLYLDIFREVARNGVKYLVVVNGHGGNVDALSMAAKDAARETKLTVILVNWWIDLAQETRRRVLETPEGHAAEMRPVRFGQLTLNWLRLSQGMVPLMSGLRLGLGFTVKMHTPWSTRKRSKGTHLSKSREG
jgi:Uncharacterized protein, putative amidase